MLFLLFTWLNDWVNWGWVDMETVCRPSMQEVLRMVYTCKKKYLFRVFFFGARISLDLSIILENMCSTHPLKETKKEKRKKKERELFSNGSSICK
jgi:hypothetical protein